MPIPILEPFSIAHRLKDDSGRGMLASDAARVRTAGCFVDTCQRQLVIVPRTNADRAHTQASLEWRHDHDAYAFLLQTACGLNSPIPGETNVLGQIKRAWTDWQESAGRRERQSLAPLMRRLFDDSAAIRNEHLHGIGGHSYGSLLRKLLQPRRDDRVLIVGAGALAQSLLPYLRNATLGIWNRNAIDALDGAHIFAPADAARAAVWANRIVLTTPADPENDGRWFTHVVHGQQNLVHLGCRRASRGIWARLPAGRRFADLDDLFDLRSRQSSVRSLRVGYARKACTALAQRLCFADADERTPQLLARRA
jgi:hypothetical protein